MFRFSVLALAALVAAASSAAAQRRLAFVAGVNTYDNLGPEKQLAKAVNDAKALTATLTDLGFEVALQENPRRAEFNRAWQAFLNKVQPNDHVAVFFSGHGVQVGGLNYLMPRDVPKFAQNEEDLVREESISLQRLLDNAKARSPRLMLMIIDACRDNPFTLPGGRSLGGAARGLARIDPPGGAFIMLSAGAGQTALDRLPGNDPEPTSVYTRHLLPLMKQPGITLQQVAMQVRNDVSATAARVSHTQTPAYWDELAGAPVCLNGACRDLAASSVAGVAPAHAAPAAAAPVETVAAHEWKTVDKSSAAELSLFVRRHKGAPEAEYAAARLEALPKPAAPSAPAPAEATPPPSRSLATFEQRGLAGVVRQATKSSSQVTLVVELTNRTGQPIGLGSAVDPDGHGVIVSGEGTTCKIRRVIGLGEIWEVDVSTAQMTGRRGDLNQKLTRLGVNESASVTYVASASDCEGSMRIATGQLSAGIYMSRGGRLEKAAISVGAFPIGGP